ncbi:hypothetical protein, partial [Amycolatopsis ruanii]|uniref:hypothetical protein n=1 Tax=Amycolatopsis ruanii TaxID=944491 RepID=UPI001967E124
MPSSTDEQAFAALVVVFGVVFVDFGVGFVVVGGGGAAGGVLVTGGTPAADDYEADAEVHELSLIHLSA